MIRIVPSENLGRHLGFAVPFVTPQKVYARPLSSFRMETDDAPILRYIYGNFRPRRHLEFGTWQGFGAALCASSCDAEIWTINLPGGERDAAGRPRYAASAGDLPQPLREKKRASGDDSPIQTDAGDSIGWMYREAGYGDRVHQILCDSRAWSTKDFTAGFFDSVLIDGGHAPDVVRNDTDKAIPLLASGGLMIWHDFTADIESLEQMEASRGVVRAVVENLDRWSKYFKDIFWIRPSLILMAIRI